jgi:hypothetical protein
MRLGLKLAAVFLLLFLATAVYLELAATDAMQSFLLLIFALPWALFIPGRPSPPANHIVNDILIVYLPVALNTVIIYCAGNVLGNALNRRR